MDGIVVIAHDYDLVRTAKLNTESNQSNAGNANILPNQQKKYIGEYNFDELPYLRTKFTTGLFGEQVFEHDDETVKICSLEQLFQLCNSNDPEFVEFNDSIVNIDLK